MAEWTRSPALDSVRLRVARLRAGQFLRYGFVSLVTVPTGYTLLLLARSNWDVNAGLLNLVVGTVLTVPSFVLYRRFVWSERESKGLFREIFAFWRIVMLVAIASGIFLGVADALGARGFALIAAGLTGQVALFIARYFWLDRVTFATART